MSIGTRVRPTGIGGAGPLDARHRRGSGRALVFTGAAVILGVVIAAHERIPDAFGSAVMLDAAAPWLVVLVPILALAALLLRSPAGAAATLIPVMAWAWTFGTWWAPNPHAPSIPATGTVQVVSQNLFADNSSPTATARALVATHADIIAVQEFAGTDREPVQRILDDAYPYNEVVGTVAVWSRYPTSDTTSVDVGLPWKRGMRTHIETPRGDLIVYVVHLPSVRPGDTATRNAGLSTLSRRLTADTAERVVVAGDFNTPGTDRHWTGFATGYRDTHSANGSGPGFTWPASFPLTRLDHILVRGSTTLAAAVLRLPGPDHLAVSATIDLDR
ncbi:endonuclease/exonuclease/phosphatase family protein [Nocardia sp. NPDC051030]|uniref:endonuclease/exonuclease/phosphatase family protein n=1 Tax=Nocardia sp. NPDC051030 TaxID=3155162 RepID=UPI003443DC61